MPQNPENTTRPAGLAHRYGVIPTRLQHPRGKRITTEVYITIPKLNKKTRRLLEYNMRKRNKLDSFNVSQLDKYIREEVTTHDTI